MRPDRRQAFGMILGGAAALSLPVRAVETSETLLTLRNLRLSGAHGSILFDRAGLEEMPWQTVETGNPFVDHVATFRGPSAFGVASQIGHAGARQVRLIAANDYFTEVELSELDRFDAILAMEMNGRPLTLRDYGPIWVMYPLDLYSELQDSVYNSRLVTQLRVMELF